MPALGVLALIELIAGVDTPLYHTVRQERTSRELRGRVFATVSAAEAIAVPPAVLLARYVVEALGLRAAVAVFAGGNALYAIFSLALPATCELDPPDRSSQQIRRVP